MPKVDLQNQDTVRRVRAAGIKWRMKDYREGLDLTAETIKELGLTIATPAPPKPSVVVPSRIVSDPIADDTPSVGVRGPLDPKKPGK